MNIMSFFKKKVRVSVEDVISSNQELRNENLTLQKQGYQQAQEMAVEIKNLMDQIQELNDRYDDESHQLRSKLADTESESELLLLQLHQTQEELEEFFLKDQKTQEEFAVLQHNHGQSQSQLQERLAQMQTDNQGLSAKKTELEAKIAELQHNHGQSQSQLQERLAQMQTDNQGLSAKKTELEAKIAELQHNHGPNQSQLQERLAQMQTDNQGLSAKKTELEAKIADLQSTQSQSHHQLQAAQEESELILLQLHQVQEELEHYFIENQKLQTESELYQNRWKRLETRHPNYLDYESIVPVRVDTVSEIPQVEWCATDITIDGLLVSAFKFTTLLQDGNVGIELIDEINELNPESPIRLVPKAISNPNSEEAIVQFRQLTSAQWRKILVALMTIQYFFKDPQKSGAGKELPEYFDLVFWRQALSPLVTDLSALPPIFRFNEIKLKRELMNVDYEHLWLVFKGASYGQYQWPTFELRLGAANISPTNFSNYPKLEIPRIDGKHPPFNSWYEESFDDFGSKLEIRFDLNKQLFDVNVWSQLSTLDQSLLISIMGTLINALKRMQQNKVPISRSWDEWIRLAVGLANTMSNRLTQLRELQKEEQNKNEAITDKEPLNDSSAVTDSPKTAQQGQLPQGAVSQSKTQAQRPTQQRRTNKKRRR